LLGAGFPILVGGSGAASYHEALAEISATPVPDLPTLSSELAKLV
jgi:hypothetical protein